jgi:hypothetical protein
MYKVRRRRKLGDKVKRNEATYEIVGDCGNGHYQIQWFDSLWGEKPRARGPIYQANLGTWVEDVTNVRPYPFGG